jgi:hypothetical protein
VVSIGFIEQEQWTPKSIPALAKLYDYVWISPNTVREDPCKDFSLPHGPKNSSDIVVKTDWFFKSFSHVQSALR